MKKISLILAAFLLISCGARKVNVSSSESNTKHETESTLIDKSKTITGSDSNVKTNINVERNEDTGTVTETYTDEPIDNNRPAIIIDKEGKKIELNNSKRTVSKITVLSSLKIKDLSNIVEVQKVSKVQQNSINSASREAVLLYKKEYKKDLDKKADYSWILWAILALLAIRVTYCIKTKTPFI